MADSRKAAPSNPSVTPGQALQVLGVLILAAGIGLAWLWLGIAVLGAGLVLIGLSLELS